MSAGMMDDHPCGSCLRWPECNGVDWPRCQAGVNFLVKRISCGVMTKNQARELLGLEETKEDRTCQQRTNPQT